MKEQLLLTISLFFASDFDFEGHEMLPHGKTGPLDD